MTTIAALIRPSGLVAVPAPRRKASPDGPPCRCCLKPLETAFQPGWERRPEGHTLLTCRAPGCRMSGHTLTADDYESADLSRYGAVEVPGWRSAFSAYMEMHDAL
jgi:hypothetical protein